MLASRSRAGTLRLLPAASHDIGGDPDPATWRYRLNLAGPDRQFTIEDAVPEGVVHCRYSTDPERPWRGYGPLQVAQLAGSVCLRRPSQRWRTRASGPRGSPLAYPQADGQDPTVVALKADLKALKGGLALVEQQGAEFGAGDGRTVNSDWSTKRLGADPPSALVELAKMASGEIFAACGIPPGIFDPKGTAQGAREDYRRFIALTVAPLARLVTRELSIKLESDVTMSLDPLHAFDVTGRASAFAKLVQGGMSLERAVALSGLMAQDDDAA